MPTWTTKEARLDLVEMSWRMRSLHAQTRILECGIYCTDGGFEIRCGYIPDDLLYLKLLRDLDHGRSLAAELRELVIRTRAFEELPVA